MALKQAVEVIKKCYVKEKSVLEHFSDGKVKDDPEPWFDPNFFIAGARTLLSNEKEADY